MYVHKNLCELSVTLVRFLSNLNFVDRFSRNAQRIRLRFEVLIADIFSEFMPWRWRQEVSPKQRYRSTQLRGVTSQRTVNLNFQIIVPSLSLFIRCVLSVFFSPFQVEWYQESFQLMGHIVCSEQAISLILTCSHRSIEKYTGTSNTMKWRPSWDSAGFSAAIIHQM